MSSDRLQGTARLAPHNDRTSLNLNELHWLDRPCQFIAGFRLISFVPSIFGWSSLDLRSLFAEIINAYRRRAYRCPVQTSNPAVTGSTPVGRIAFAVGMPLFPPLGFGGFLAPAIPHPSIGLFYPQYERLGIAQATGRDSFPHAVSYLCK